MNFAITEITSIPIKNISYVDQRDVNPYNNYQLISFFSIGNISLPNGNLMILLKGGKNLFLN